MKRMAFAALLTLLLASSCGGDTQNDGPIVGDDVINGDDVPHIVDEDVVSGDEDTKPIDRPDSGTLCSPGETYCEDEDTLRTCLDDGAGWLAENCDDGLVCQDGACVVLSCEPGERRCTEDGSGWEMCLEDGSAWSEATACDESSACIQGVCLEQQCEPDDVVCDDSSILICDEDGLGWTRTDCADGEVCFAGQCVECVNADQCDDGEFCDDGVCTPEPVTIVPPSPPLGTEGQSYGYVFDAVGGLPPYAWSVTAGALPAGLTLSTDGALSGQPSLIGDFVFTVAVEDEHGSTDDVEVTITVETYVEGVRIISTSPLPSATEGEPYATQLEVSGGTPPYAWMINTGELPNGLGMDAMGGIGGTPDQAVGDFAFNVRVFDNSADSPTQCC